MSIKDVLMTRILTFGLLAVALVVPACSSSSKSPKSSAAAASGGASGSTVTIKNFSFSPNPLKVKAGASLQVMNADGTAHTVTADDKSFNTSRIEGGASKPITAPTKAGTYAYHCDIHDYMKGSLVVS